MPGKYTLYIHDKTETLAKADMTVDQNLRVKVKNIRECDMLGLDEILTSCLEDKFPTWKTIACTPGLAEMRLMAMEKTQVDLYNRIRTALEGKELRQNKNLLIETIGTLDVDVSVFRAFHILIATGELKMIDCSTLFDITRNNPYEPLSEQLAFGAPATIFLTNINALHATGGKVIVKNIADKLNKEHGFSIWMCGTRQDINSVLEVFPSFGQFFTSNRRLKLNPYTAFEMVQTFYEAVNDSGVTPSKEATDTLTRAVMKGHENGTLTGWRIGDIKRFVEDNILPRFIKRAIANVDFETPDLLQPQDIDTEQLSGGCSAYEQSIRELNEMIGLDNIKSSITTMANRTKFYLERRRLGLRTSDKAVFHAIFTGNPGTGKTTVARMMGKIYRSLGLLSRGEVITIDRTHMVGRFIGETEDNMKLLLEEARGNVLFIDEAYTLYDGASDRKDFGCRVIDSLLTVLAQPDPDMLIVFAGYEKEMDAMLSINPGLFGRFPYKFRFSDYTADQLMQIACKVFNQDQYVLTDEARSYLFTSIEQTLMQRTKNFGNARWIEQYVRNGIIPALADRITALGGRKDAALYQTIEAADVRAAYERFNPKTIELRPRRQVGFSA